ncbi:hypothetical protein M501DRAFT_941589 [Patellaria atrata CBS 101060]|uniref:Uncharacterized protein n=1 Tax=Patellaria atrata CBS 101060 TaxID=1346257 RepID=A0A9P4S3Z9_9PEZI|nr:hypothetical protein M501DRAFT_941589 [Patellaria atrata CBS 101060]
MSAKFDDPSLPSYEDSIRSEDSKTPSSIAHQRRPDGQDLVNHLTNVRGQHLSKLIDERILPLLEQQALYGIARTTIALVPSDLEQIDPALSEGKSYPITRCHPSAAPLELVSLSEGENVHQIQLQGQLNGVGFWTQPGVVDSLENMLRICLASSSRLHASSAPLNSAQVQPPTLPPRRNFFSKKSSSSSPVARQFSQPSTGDEKKHLVVRASLEDLCFRTLSAFGLYDTVTGRGVVLRVEINL